MTDRMRACLLEAMMERFPGYTREQHEPILERSLEAGAHGFLLETLWRALELATLETERDASR